MLRLAKSPFRKASGAAYRAAAAPGVGVRQKCSGPMKSGCGQCPHFGLRIGSYIGRIGSDCVCFWEFPVFPRPGVRFESHLGHSIPLVRGVLAFMCGH